METSEQQNPAIAMTTEAAETPRAAGVDRVRPPRRVFSLIGAVAAVLMAALLVRALVANPGGPLLDASGAPSGSLDSGQQPVTPSGVNGTSLIALAMVSPSEGWLFGSRYQAGPMGGPCTECGSFMLRYDGTHWKRAPGTIDIPISAVSMLSSGDGWAVAQSTIYHYAGGAWNAVYTYSVPNDNIYLNTIAMVSPDEGWVGGTDGGPNSEAGFLLHYAKGHWQRVALPDGNAAFGINAISMLSPEEGWALEISYGQDLGASSRLLHYAGGAWHAVGDAISATLTSLAVVSSGTVWMVGAVTGTTGGIFAYQDGQIKRVKSPTPNILHGITMLSPTDGWAVGDGAATLHWDGTRWTKVGLVFHGVALMGVSFPTPGEGWAEGNGESGDAQGAVLLHYTHGAWSVFPLTIGG